MFITFEGIDGSGKSTQIERLKESLDEAGHKVSVFREPGGTELSEKIRALLLDAKNAIDPVTELLLFSSARSQLIAEEVIPRLKKGEVVILDRYYDSTTAYQGYGRRSASLEEIDHLNKLAGHGVEPDITFLLELTPEEAGKRTSGQHKDRMEQAGDPFYRRVVEGFGKLAADHERIYSLDATESADQLHKKILSILEARLRL